jgi:hypothetical protein
MILLMIAEVVMKVLAERVTALATALNLLPEINEEVRMTSISEPTCGTPGCHAGLLWLAMEFSEKGQSYSWMTSAHKTAKFLFADDRATMDDLMWFADRNPEWWGNNCGGFMFANGMAFGERVNSFEEWKIAEHWLHVAERGDMLAECVDVEPNENLTLLKGFES